MLTLRNWTRWLSNLHSIKYINEQNIGSTCSLENPSWGSGINHGRGQRKILNSKVTSPHKTRNSQVLWVWKVLSGSMPSSSSWRSTSWPCKWLKTIPSDRYWLCWTINLYKESGARRKSLHSCVQLQLITSSINGPHERSKPWRISDQSTTIHCS